MMSSSRSILIVAAALAMLLSGKIAPAQDATGPPCATRQHVVQYLQANFGEQLIGHGLSENGTILEIYVGPKGTWTIISTAPSGISCLLTGGAAWETIRQAGPSS